MYYLGMLPDSPEGPPLNFSAEAIPAPEQQLTSELKEQVVSSGFEDFPPLDPERREQIEKDIGDTATLFNSYGKPWFLAGGSALECSKGKFTRDHQDTDVALYYDDLAGFYEYGRQHGYQFISVEGNEISSQEELLTQEENAFLNKQDHNQPGPQGFEIMFLRKNDKGEVIFGGDERLTVPGSVYENSPKYTAKNGQEVPLTPPDIQLLHKLYDGRQKDYHDIKQFYPTLTEEEKQRFITALQTLNTCFVTEDKEIDSVEELLQHTEATTQQVKEKFAQSGKVEEVVTGQSERLNTSITKIFSLFESTSFPEEFHKELKREFGEEAMVRLKDQVDAVTSFLYKDPKPTQLELKGFAYQNFNVREQTIKKIKDEVLDMKRWRVKK